jgi:predicted regulator of Ras-like GTPase activity (Roadblock/LC7/MglB family)
MQAVLKQMAAVPGVFGGLACDAEGKLLSQAFPPTFEIARLREAAASLADRASALQKVLGTVGMIDLRYGKARIVVTSTEGARLLFLCSPSMNTELLAMSLSSALRRHAPPSAPPPVAASPPAAPAAPAAPARTGGELFAIVQRVEAFIEASAENHYRLRGLIAVKAGFTLDFVDAETPDDPVRIQKLKVAVKAVLGTNV